MLYDELVPKGEYLAHYGVPKDQWSPEAKARHNRRHPNKTIDPITIARGFEHVRDTYQENNRSNRSFGSKVDEHRFQLAEARHRNRSQHNSGDEGNKPNSGQHTPDYRKPRTSSYKTPGANAKPGRGRSSGKPTSSSNSGYNPMRARFTRTPDPSINDVEAERRTNASIRPNRSAGKKPSSGKSSSGSYKPTPSSQSADRAIANAISSLHNSKGNGAKGNSSWDRAVKDKLKEQDRPNNTPVASKTKKRFATSQELRPWPEQSTTSGKKPAQSTDNGWTKPKPANKQNNKDVNKKKKKKTNTK